MIHTYGHTFQNGIRSTLRIDAKARSLEGTEISFNLGPPKMVTDPWFYMEFRHWWNMIIWDFQGYGGVVLPNPYADPKWKGF